MRAVFKNLDPFEEPFAEAIRVRALLYPVEDWNFVEAELPALQHAVRAAGDEGFYVTRLERQVEQPPDEPEDWFFPLDDIAAYPGETSAPFETALVSPSATWGIMFSHEFHAVIGGVDVFVETLYAELNRDPEQEARKMIEHWLEMYGRRTSSWIPSLMHHIYGSRAAPLVRVFDDWPAKQGRLRGGDGER
jgi:hypothetical protein